MTAFLYRSPEADVVELKLLYGVQTTVREWTKYSFNAHYETPTDGWSFSVGDDDLRQELKDALVPGQLVQFTLNGIVQGTGYIDTVTRNVTRGGGTEWTIEGRDVFSPMVDAHVDPRKQFKKDMTLEHIVREICDRFAPVAGEWEYSFDGEANRKVKTGRPRGGRGSKAGDGTGKGGGRAGKKLDQLRPSQHEGAFTFLTKLLHRQGLHCYPSVDGTTVIVDQPNYNQTPTHFLYRTGSASNILDGAVKWSVTEQPSIIIADGKSGGGEFGHSQIMAKMVNPFTGVDRNGNKWPDVEYASRAYPQATEIYMPDTLSESAAPRRWVRQFHARPLFLHDENARTLEELEAFVRREMSLRLRKTLSVTYTLEGHGQYTEGGEFVPFATDTIVRVLDEPGGLNDVPMWVLSRTFEKSRSGGTTTKLELIIPGTLQFSES